MHKPGKDQNPEDYFLRVPLQRHSATSKAAEKYINFIVKPSIPAALSIEQIFTATNTETCSHSKISLQRNPEEDLLDLSQMMLNIKNLKICTTNFL